LSMMHPNSPKRRMSLGLLTSTSFELRLLEVAVKGKKAFEALWNKESGTYGVNEQVMYLEILQEIKLWEKEGNSKLLLERARNQVVRIKDYKSLHNRALVVYRDFLNLSLSRDSIEFNQCRARESKDLAIPYLREGPEFSSMSQIFHVEQKLEQQSIKYKEPLEEGSPTAKDTNSRTAQGEPSASSSCEIISIFGDVSCSSSIFDNPNPSDMAEGGTPGARLSERVSEVVIAADKHEGEDSVPSLEIKNDSKDEPIPEPGMNKDLARSESLEILSMGDSGDVDLKIDNAKEVPKVLQNLEEDFNIRIWWTIDRFSFREKSIADLRSNHHILIEGSFRKRCRSRRWRNYYGFFLATGVVVYFRKGDFKKFADMRNSTPRLPKDKPCRLDIRDVIIASNANNWLLKFDSANHRDAWYQTVDKISKDHKDKMNDLQLSLESEE